MMLQRIRMSVKVQAVIAAKVLSPSPPLTPTNTTILHCVRTSLAVCPFTGVRLIGPLVTRAARLGDLDGERLAGLRASLMP
jgi:hypothetical protein